MVFLLLTSLVWAFSFGLIKRHLGGLDAAFVAFARLAISFLLFLPFWRPRKVSANLSVRLFLNGMIQFGLMYALYIYSFRFLAAHQVALFTIFTPLYVAAFDDLFQKRFQLRHFWTALLAVTGTAVIVYASLKMENVLAGFALLQTSNVCFAFGQVYYKKIMVSAAGLRHRDVFAWLYLGGAVAAALAMLLFSRAATIQLRGAQLAVLLYLGLLASGIGFFLWNVGATRVGTGVLAVFNNVKVPLAVLVSLLFFREQTDLARLALGGGIILLALYLNSRRGGQNFVRPK